MAARPKLTSASSKPWYLVPGRVDLTEKRLSAKYERDARRMSQWQRAHKYFNDCTARVKMFKSWEERTPKPLVNLPPFDCQVNPCKVSVQVDEDEVNRIHDELTTQLDYIRQLNEQNKQLKLQSDIFIAHIETAEDIAIDLKNQMEKLDTKWRKVQFTRSVRDRLICQVFIIIDKVTALKSSTELLENLVNTSVLTPRECQEFRSILDEAKCLLKTLLNLNHSRHLQMSRIYSEEAGRLRDQVLSEWEEEEQMCLELFNQIHDALHSGFVEKVRQNANNLGELLNRRKELLSDLTKYVSTLQSDSILWDFLSNRTLELSIPQDESDEDDFESY